MLRDRLKAARKAAKKTQAQVAIAVGMTQPSYSELETGKSQASTLLPSIADFLGVDALWLQTGKGEMTPERIHQIEDPQLQSLLESLQRFGAARKLPPELISTLQNTLNMVISIQESKDTNDPALQKKIA